MLLTNRAFTAPSVRRPLRTFPEAGRLRLPGWTARETSGCSVDMITVRPANRTPSTTCGYILLANGPGRLDPRRLTLRATTGRLRMFLGRAGAQRRGPTRQETFGCSAAKATTPPATVRSATYGSSRVGNGCG